MDYLDSTEYGSKGFKSFFEGWMEAKSVVNLKPLQGTPQYAPANARNFGYITSCRDEACAELATAAANGRLLLWTEGTSHPQDSVQKD